MEELPPREDKNEGEDDPSLRGRVAAAVRDLSQELSRDAKTRLADEARARQAEQDEERKAREDEKLLKLKLNAYKTRQAAQEIAADRNLGMYDVELMQAVAKRLAQVERDAQIRERDPNAIWDEFTAWQQSAEGTLAWLRFKELRDEWAERKRKEREREEAERRRGNREACRQAAVSAAIALRDANPRGPNARVGTVCAGLAHISGIVWTGTSGGALDLHPVMRTLLDGIGQIEDWPLAACGEVHAMNQYLTAQGIGSINEIDGEDLFSHAETWNAVENKWQGRAACRNCSQWMDKVKINRA